MSENSTDQSFIWHQVQHHKQGQTPTSSLYWCVKCFLLPWQMFLLMGLLGRFHFSNGTAVLHFVASSLFWSHFTFLACCDKSLFNTLNKYKTWIPLPPSPRNCLHGPLANSAFWQSTNFCFVFVFPLRGATPSLVPQRRRITIDLFFYWLKWFIYCLYRLLVKT